MLTAERRGVPTLRAVGLEAWRGEHCLFESLDFTAEPGGIVLVVGPNGAGKTTLLRILAGLTPPTGGRVTWGAADIRALPDEQRGRVAYRGHLEALKGDLTARESLEFSRRITGSGGRVDETAGRLGLAARLDVRVRDLSAGQRRRVGLGCLELGDAQLWVLDEPMTHLDSAGRTLVAERIRDHADSGRIAIIATHQPEELARSGTLMIEL